MSNIVTLFLVLITFSATSDAFASTVFKCVDENGQTTFAFQPCIQGPKTVESFNDSDEQAATAHQTIERQLARLETIDIQISQVNIQFRDLRLEQEADLLAMDDQDTQRQTWVSYQESTARLLKEIVSLRSERNKVVEGPMALLTSSE
ncbi:MAG: DUF4124 domain-containing protein [Pseudomonadales bacterium]